LLAALVRSIEVACRRDPLLLIFEDAHWIDPTSREFLDGVIGQIERLRAMIIVTYRPEFQATWTGQPHVTSMSLSRLDQESANALVRHVAGDQSPPDAVVREIVARTDGVPLYIEELTKTVLEAVHDDD